MIRLPDDASHEAIHKAVEKAKAYARSRGCRHLVFEPVCEAIGIHHNISRMHLKAVIDGKEETLLIGPRTIHPKRKLTPMTQVNTIDLTKPVRDKSGRPVQILRTDLKNPTYTVVAIRTDADGTETPQLYKANGRFFDHRTDDECDLENVPQPKYRLLYEDGTVCPHMGWLEDKRFKGYDLPGRIGYIVKVAGQKPTFEAI